MIEEDKIFSLERARRGFKTGIIYGAAMGVSYLAGTNAVNLVYPNAYMFPISELANSVKLIGENARDWKEVVAHTALTLAAYSTLSTFVDSYRPTSKLVEKLTQIPDAIRNNDWRQTAENWLGDNDLANQRRRAIVNFAIIGGGVGLTYYFGVGTHNPFRAVSVGAMAGIGLALAGIKKNPDF